MLLMWTPGLGELLVLLLIVFFWVFVLRRIAGNSRGAAHSTDLEVLNQRVSELERRLNERDF